MSKKIPYRLLIDDRERQVSKYFADIFAPVPIFISRLKFGDFQIVDEYNNVLIIIERKTWGDLAASIKDGRALNINELLNFRQYNIGIVLLIEGEHSYTSNYRIANIPFKALQSKLDHLALEKGISIIYANSGGQNVATRIKLLFDSLDTLCKANRPYDNGITFNSTIVRVEGAAEIKTVELNSIKVDQRTIIEKSSIQMWCCLRGITEVSAEYILDHYSMYDYFMGIIPDSFFENMPMGICRFGERRTDKLKKSIKKPKVRRRIILCIPGIGNNTLEKLFQSIKRFKNIIIADIDTLESSGLKSKIARNMYDILRYKRKKINDDESDDGL